MISNPTHLPRVSLRTIVIEDEPDSLNWLLEKVASYPELDLVGYAMTLDTAFQLIALKKPEAAFMDIELAGGTIFELLERLRVQGLPIPYIVITTAFPKYIWSAFNDYRFVVVQYLTKPFVEDWSQKFRKAIDALLAANSGQVTSTLPLLPPTLPHNSAARPRYIFINARQGLMRIDFDKTCYLETAGGGETFVIMENVICQVDLTLTKFLDLLPTEEFYRISRSNAVNLTKIICINRENHTLEIDVYGGKSKKLSIGEGFYTDLLQLLPTIKELSTR